MRFLQHAVAAAALLTAAACVDSENATAPRRATRAPSFNTTSVTEPTTGPWARIVEGAIGPGALYALYIPRTWNGDAVHYVHGVGNPDEPVDLDDDAFAAIRDLLGAQGFAIAYSSWSANGMAVKDAAIRVHQLRGILAAELQQAPSRSFVLSSSLGGAIALDLLQTYPAQYDGALLVCGMVGGPALEIQWAGNVRALFDLFYPGALPGSVTAFPPGAPPVTLSQVAAAVQSNPTPLFLIASLTQTPLAYRPLGSPLNPSSIAFQTLVGSLFGPLSLHSRLVNNTNDLAHGHPYFDNSATTYSLGANPLLPASVLQPLVDLANANVGRYAADAAGRNFMDHLPAPTGELRVPVLTLHNTWDPAMPLLHETTLYEKVAAAGATQNLLQRLYPAYGHCTIPAAVLAQNFSDMVNWVTTGVKPAS